jgi:hypothetical protein
MAWNIFMIFAFAVPLVNGDDNADVVQVTLQQGVERLQNKITERFQNTKLENWQQEADLITSEINAMAGGHPHHHSNHHHSKHHHSNHGYGKKHFTKAELKAGRKFLEYNHSSLYIEAKKAIHGYTSAAMTLTAGRDRQAANITDDDLLTYKEPWCKELRLSYGETICNDTNGYRLSRAWFHTKCMLEECVDGNDTHAGCLGAHGATRLTLLVELYDALMKQMPDVEAWLGQSDIQEFGAPDTCPGEEDAIVLLKSKQRQNNMLARHHQIQQAMAHTKEVAEGLLATASTASNQEHAKDSIQRVWEHICGHLKCDQDSWMDIHDAMHGHVVDLQEEGMPVRTLIEHVRSLRKTNDAVITAAQKLTLPEIDHILNGSDKVHPHAANLFQMVTKTSTSESGSSRYESLGKELIAVYDAAYALKHGSTVDLTGIRFCFKLVGGSSVIYAPDPWTVSPPLPMVGPLPFKLAIAFQFNCGGKLLQVFERFFNGGPKAAVNGVACNFKFALALGVGPPSGFEQLAGAKGAIALVGVVELKDWSPYEQANELQLHISVLVAVSATWLASPGMTAYQSCLIGATFGPLKCKVNVAAGIAFVCMEAQILPWNEAKADSARDMPLGPTSYGRDCTESGWGGTSGFNGKNYMWCYTESGGWDYTCPVTESPQVPQTTRHEECFKPCGFHGYSYKWCYTDNWDNWDYCCVPDVGSCGEACEEQTSRLLESP